MQSITNLFPIYSKDNKPCYTAKSGEVLKFHTADCFTGLITSEQQKLEELEGDLDLATGPVFVEGAQKGDVLVVDILDIKVGPKGIASLMAGALMDTAEPRIRILDIVDGAVTFNNVSWQIDPMIGVIGLAPEKEEIPCVAIGNHGGNMDSKMIKKGSRVYLPVQTEGALFGVGDVHACQGDGELSGIALEIDAEIILKLTLIKNFELNWPVTEIKEKWYVNAIAQDFHTASISANKELQRLIMAAYGWDATDTFMYLSMQGDIEINQFVSPTPEGLPPIGMSIRVGIPKQVNMPLIKR